MAKIRMFQDTDYKKYVISIGLKDELKENNIWIHPYRVIKTTQEEISESLLKKCKQFTMSIEENSVALPIYTRPIPKKSKGQLFKEKHGYSKTMKRLMAKYEAFGLDEYRKIRAKERKERAAYKKAKHIKVIAGRRSKAERLAMKAQKKKK